jgi:hypothetical protein
MTPTAEAANGQGMTRDALEDKLLGEPLTEGYRPTLPTWLYWATETIPQLFLLRDIELMVIHPVVLSALNFFKGGISGVEFDVRCEHPEAAPFIDAHCRAYWDRGVPLLQGGYEYGWIAAECLYTDRDGPLAWDGFAQFSPRDVFLLTRERVPVGVRVRQVPLRQREQGPTDGQKSDSIMSDARGQGAVDLWLASADVPAKGLWYVHNPRYSQFYGQSQLLGAWRPWRRLAWKDGAETNIDGGFYRFFYSGPLVKYPEEDYQAQPGAPATTLDSQGRPRRYARDMARMMAEQYKSGAGVGMPSTKYHPDLGGGDKWELVLPKSTLNIDGGVNYVKHLWDQIRYGVGVPPELMEAAETGSGYSGRSIPLEAFLLQQQRLADNFLDLFVAQVLRPLVRWNFGPVRFEVKVKPLLETKSRLKQAQGGHGSAEQPGSSGLPGQAPPEGVPGFERPLPGPAKSPGVAAQAPPLAGWGGFSLNAQGLQPLGLTEAPLITDRVRQIALDILQRA